MILRSFTVQKPEKSTEIFSPFPQYLMIVFPRQPSIFFLQNLGENLTIFLFYPLKFMTTSSRSSTVQKPKKNQLRFFNISSIFNDFFS